jgi:hypothetical protein
MRKTATTLLVAALTAILVTPALAVSLLSEPFIYADGNLVPNGGWATHSGTGTDIQVVSGTAVGNNANAPDDNRTFTAQAANAKVYGCLTITIPTPAAPPDTNYIAHFKDTGTSNFWARVWVGASGNTFTFGLSAGSCACNTNCVPVFWATPLLYDTPYRVAISYDGATGNAELWVDPLNESSLKITATGGAAPPPQPLSSFALRQSSSPPTACPGGNFNWSYVVDNLGVGTTFDDACATGQTPTERSTWGSLKSIYR